MSNVNPPGLRRCQPLALLIAEPHKKMSQFSGAIVLDGKLMTPGSHSLNLIYHDNTFICTRRTHAEYKIGSQC